MRMRAAVLHEDDGPIVVEDVDVDEPGPQEVLIRTAAAGVCHTDLKAVSGVLPFRGPLVIGHESAGVVERVGSAVTYVQPGDHVVTCASVFCGRCEYCLTGRPALCQREGVLRPPDAQQRLSFDGAPLLQMSQIGSFSEFLLVHEHSLVKIRKEMPLDRAALLGCAVTTGLGAVFNTARVTPGSKVAVIGCGGVGLSAVQGARIAGALEIIAVDLFPARRELARELGATRVVDPAAGDAVDQVIELTAGGVDYALEVVGRPETAAQAFAMLRPGGTATIVGAIVGAKIEIDGSQLLYERRLQGSLMGSNRFRVDIPRYVELYLQGRLRLDEVVTAHYHLEEIDEAFATAERGQGARTVILFNGTAG